MKLFAPSFRYRLRCPSFFLSSFFKIYSSVRCYSCAMESALLQQTVASSFAAANSQQCPVSRASSQVCSLKPTHLGNTKVFLSHMQVLTPVRRPNFRVHAIKDPSSQDSLKRAVAKKAIELVKSGMVVGLGTGSTSSMAIEELGKLISQNKLKDVVGVATSYQSRVLARQFGVKTVDLNDVNHIDIAFDGADEVSVVLVSKVAYIVAAFVIFCYTGRKWGRKNMVRSTGCH